MIRFFSHEFDNIPDQKFDDHGLTINQFFRREIKDFNSERAISIFQVWINDVLIEPKDIQASGWDKIINESDLVEIRTTECSSHSLMDIISFQVEVIGHAMHVIEKCGLDFEKATKEGERIYKDNLECFNLVRKEILTNKKNRLPKEKWKGKYRNYDIFRDHFISCAACVLLYKSKEIKGLNDYSEYKLIDWCEKLNYECIAIAWKGSIIDQQKNWSKNAVQAKVDLGIIEPPERKTEWKKEAKKILQEIPSTPKQHYPLADKIIKRLNLKDSRRTVANYIKEHMEEIWKDP